MDESFNDSFMADDIEVESLCRGFIEDSGSVVLPATDKYLHVLVIELHRAWAETIIADIDTIDEDDILRRLRHLSAEYDRLLNNPDLFPSEESRVRFLAAVSLDSEIQHHSACTLLLLKSEFDKIKEYTEQDFTRPSYAEDCNNWENFLLNMAPGAPNDPTDRARTIPKTSLQIIPPVGMRIISDLEREEQDIERFLVAKREAEPNIPTAVTTLMVDFTKQQDPADVMPMFSIPQQAYNATARPNPFLSTSGSMPEHVSNGLPIEQIGTFIHKLDLPPAVPGHPQPGLNAPDVFPQMTIRTWHPPARSWDLRYGDH